MTTIHGATLRGGILAGDFRSLGIVSDHHACIKSCCRHVGCDVALMLGRECFNVRCYDENLCRLAPASTVFEDVSPIITYVRKHRIKRRSEGSCVFTYFLVCNLFYFILDENR